MNIKFMVVGKQPYTNYPVLALHPECMDTFSSETHTIQLDSQKIEYTTYSLGKIVHAHQVTYRNNRGSVISQMTFLPINGQKNLEIDDPTNPFIGDKW